MTPVDETIPTRLRSLEMRLSVLEPQNLDELAQIGAGLEEVMGELEHPLLQELLVLTLEALQAIYMEAVAEPLAAVKACRHLVGASERYLRSGKYASDDPVKIAGEALWLALQRPHADCPWAEKAEKSEEAIVPEVAPSVPEKPVEEPANSWDDTASIVHEFLVESAENLDNLDQDLLALEKDPNDRETISRIFRTIHTIKGTCGFLGFSKLEALTHAGESLLSLMRDGQLSLTTPIADSLLQLVDAVRQILSSIGEIGSEGPTDVAPLTQVLTRLQTQPSATAPLPVPTTPEERAPSLELVTGAAPVRSPKRKKEKPVPIPGRLGSALIDQGYIQVGDLANALNEQEMGDQRRLGEILAAMGLVTPEIVDRALQQLGVNQSRLNPSDASIRVDVGLLDILMNLVGELVLTRNQIAQLLQVQGVAFNPELVTTAQRLNLVTTELQDAVMKTRMQPIGNVWSKFPRIVRDLAQTCGKQIRLELEGKETELDKSLIEAIRDPLTHILRNSVDHGIESPKHRVAAGKDPEGVIRLRAFHEGGQVILEIMDDGGGINTERVAQKAIERGLVTAGQVANMSERELVSLIFQPGFSTAEAVSNISGRGVGMDVVKTNIEKIGGIVEVQSQLGTGTTLLVKIPLTLAIVPALLVGVDDGLFAIPQVNLVELVRLTPERAAKEIEHVYGAPVYRLRGQLLSLLSLRQALGMEENPQPDQAVNLVVLQVGERQFGLIVDKIADSQEIVVKPLSKHLKAIDSFSGATILGDGRVSLILDVLVLAQRAQLLNETSQSRKSRETWDQDTLHESQTLLLFQVGRNGRMAIPLSAITRLEELPTALVENVGTRELVQYRGQIMPLLRLSAFLPGYQELAPRDTQLLQVVVVVREGRYLGLVVDDILDIVEESFELQNRTETPLVLGSAVIQGRLTQVLDTQAVFRLEYEEDNGNATPVLHLLPGGLSLWSDPDSGAGSDSPAANDPRATRAAADRGADQPEGADYHGAQPPQAPAARRAA